MNRFVVLICVFVAILFSSLRAGTIEEAKRAADEILKQDMVQARGDVDVVFVTATRLVDAGRLEESCRYFDGGLKIFAADFRQHIQYAEVLEKLGKHENALIHANIVLKSAEDKDLVKRAGAIANVKPEPIEPLGLLDADGAVLVLMPIGNVDEYLLAQERRQLEKDLGITVMIKSITLQMPPAGRDPKKTTLAKIRQNFMEMQRADPRSFANELARYGYIPADIADDDKLLACTVKIFEGKKNDDMAGKMKWLVTHGEHSRQWEATGLLDRVAQIVRPFEKANVRFMAVTPVDIYTGDTNYLFGWRKGANALVSYARFTAAFWNESPRRSRLQKRLHYQCLASAGHVFGLPRCSDPSCPRAYPNDLAEQDAKSDELCGVCRKGFVEAFAAYPKK